MMPMLLAAMRAPKTDRKPKTPKTPKTSGRRPEAHPGWHGLIIAGVVLTVALLVVASRPGRQSMIGFVLGYFVLAVLIEVRARQIRTSIEPDLVARRHLDRRHLDERLSHPDFDDDDDDDDFAELDRDGVLPQPPGSPWVPRRNTPEQHQHERHP